MTTLPDKPGFYWWRETPQDDWSLSIITKTGNGLAFAEFDGAYRWLGNWNRPIVEWQPVQLPGEDLLSVLKRCQDVMSRQSAICDGTYEEVLAEVNGILAKFGKEP